MFEIPLYTGSCWVVKTWTCADQVLQPYIVSCPTFFSSILLVNDLTMEIEKLHRIGESLGLSVGELREFIKDEQNRAREERVEERERELRENRN